jgi:putative membrane protein
MEKFLTDLGISATFGLLGIALAILGFKVFEWVTPKVNVEQELSEKQNTAVAIVAGALILGICYVVAHVVH